MSVASIGPFLFHVGTFRLPIGTSCVFVFVFLFVFSFVFVFHTYEYISKQHCLLPQSGLFCAPIGRGLNFTQNNHDPFHGLDLCGLGPFRHGGSGRVKCLYYSQKICSRKYVLDCFDFWNLWLFQWVWDILTDYRTNIWTWPLCPNESLKWFSCPIR